MITLLSEIFAGKYRLATLIAVIFFITYSNGKTAVPVFLLCGQSNMVSIGLSSALTAEEKKNVPNVMINVNGDCDATKKGKWLTLGPGFGNQASNFGLELLLGKTLSDSMPGKKVAFIKYAINGSPLGQASGWLPPSSNKGNGGTLYKNALNYIDAAIKTFSTAFDTAQYTPRWAGFVWLQGETDAMTQSAADAYATNLENLIKDLRVSLSTPDLPVIIPLISTVSMWTYSSKVRGAAVAMKSKLKNVDTVETKNYKTPDNMHYDAAGQINIGRVSAQRWLALHFNFEIPVQITSERFSPMSLSASNDINPLSIVQFDLSGRQLTSNFLANRCNNAPYSCIIIATQNQSKYQGRKSISHRN